MIVFLFMFSVFLRLIEINSALVKPYLSTLINIIITLKSIAAHFTSQNRDFSGLKCILARSRVRLIDCSGCFVVNFFFLSFAVFICAMPYIVILIAMKFYSWA